MIIRNATIHDLPKIVDLQNSYVRAGFVGLLRDSLYEIEERSVWFSQFSVNGPHQILVAIKDEELLGFCASFAYRGGGVFQKTIETSIYTSLDKKIKGIGSSLYSELFKKIGGNDLHLAVVGIALPNDASVNLHKKFDFEEVGIFKEYAFFQGQYISSLWMQKLM